VNEGQVVTFPVTATDADGPGPLSLGAEGLPLGATFAGGQFTWTPSAAQAGTYLITFTATDGAGLVGLATTSITVTNTVVDSDADTVADFVGGGSSGTPLDNCRFDANPNQADADLDGVGDVCDNSPLTANASQQDADGNGVGDVSDGLVMTAAMPSPSTLAGGYVPQEPIVITANVTFTQAAIPASCVDAGNQPGYLVVRPDPFNVLLRVRDSLGQEIFADQIPEGPGGTLAAPSVPGSSLVCISHTQTLSTPVGLTDRFTNLPPGTYTVEATYSSYETDPRTNPQTGSCLPGETECFGATAIWQGVAPAGAVTVPLLSVTGGDDAPVAVAQSVSVAQNQAKVLTLRGSDVDSASLTFAIGTGPAHGSLSALTGTSCTAVSGGSTCTASVTYTPALNYVGADTVTFTVTGGALTSAPALVSLTVTFADLERVSVSSSGTQGNQFSGSSAAAVSGDGRIVAFVSLATNLVSGDTNGLPDAFVYDRLTRQTARVSVSSSGAQANGLSAALAVSGNGRYVALVSAASNLVSGDSNNQLDVFVRDRQTNQTSRVSVSSSGAQANGASVTAAINGDGRYVAFSSSASNLVSGDTNTNSDVFVRDRQTNQTTRVSIATGGGQANGASLFPALSADGRYVAFTSWATNLVPGDTNGKADIFVHDRQTGQTTRVSVTSAGVQASGDSLVPSLSADGRFVTYSSSAATLVAGDTNNKSDVFVHDRQTGQTARASVRFDGSQANGDSLIPALSGDGQTIVFISTATNLITGDTNGNADVYVVGNPLP
jgi:hypothetical protein